METVLTAINDRIETLTARIETYTAILTHLERFSHYKAPSSRLDNENLPHRARLHIRKQSYSDRKELAVYCFWKNRHDVWVQVSIKDEPGWYVECQQRIGELLGSATTEIGNLSRLRESLPAVEAAHADMLKLVQSYRERFSFGYVPEEVSKALPLLFGSRLYISGSRGVYAET